ncbi:MAG TPA: hypothetical protein VIF57_13020 [Polyangia bacterium]|jgi:hypothetical protein
MSSKNDLTRKEFLTLTFTLIGSTAVGAAACSSDNNNPVDAGGRGGTTGTGGATGGAGGHGGGGGTGGAGGNTAGACTDPLPDTMIPDSTMHSHTLMIPASTVDATTAQTINTGTTDGHMHMVTLQPADLATLKGGGNVTMTTSSAMAPGGPVHTHMYMISCH